MDGCGCHPCYALAHSLSSEVSISSLGCCNLVTCFQDIKLMLWSSRVIEGGGINDYPQCKTRCFEVSLSSLSSLPEGIHDGYKIYKHKPVWRNHSVNHNISPSRKTFFTSSTICSAHYSPSSISPSVFSEVHSHFSTP